MVLQYPVLHSSVPPTADESDDIKRTTDVKTDREKVLGIVLGYSSFLFRSVSHVIDCVVELGRVVVDVAVT